MILESFSPVLGELVELFDQGSHHRRDRQVEEILNVVHGLLVAQVQAQFVLHFFNSLVGLESDIRNTRVHHQREQIEHQVGVSSEMQEGGVTLLPELVIMLRSDASHGLHHFLAELHRRWQRLRISAQYVSEVYVKQLPRSREEQVVQVPVPDTQDVCNYAIAR